MKAKRKTYTAEDLKGCNGRRVLVEGILDMGLCSDEESVAVHFPGSCIGAEVEDHYAYASPSAIVKILPQEIGVGDFVAARGDKGVFRVEHMKGGWAWLFSDHSCSGELRSLSDLTLIEPAQ